MTYYRTCPICGANLDPDEKCEDCNEKSPSSAGTEQEAKDNTHY